MCLSFGHYLPVCLVFKMEWFNHTQWDDFAIDEDGLCAFQDLVWRPENQFPLERLEEEQGCSDDCIIDTVS